MPDYQVTFVIDVEDAESPLAAAREVADLLAGDDPDGDTRYAYRAIYEVKDSDSGARVDVDLSKTE